MRRDAFDAQIDDLLLLPREYMEQIKPHTVHPIAWIRNEAKRYVQKYGQSE